MKEKTYYLGIDTSCYTTSCAIVDNEGTLIGEERRLLEVKEGARGLQQSVMVFQHTRALPALVEALPKVPISAIGVSAFPRREKDSYMPAFLVGHGYGRVLAHMLKVPLYEFSHQENHILAACRSLGYIPDHPFYSLHLSGGTTELLYSEPHEEHLFTCKLIGGSNDLNSGQLIDRIGVALGLPFPAGPHLEVLARKGDIGNPLKVSCKEGQLSFSGPYSQAMRRIEEGLIGSKENLAREVFQVISLGLQKLVAYHVSRQFAPTFIAVGGVMSNTFIRQDLELFLQSQQITPYFALPQYSADNSTGVAYGAALKENL